MRKRFLKGLNFKGKEVKEMKRMKKVCGLIVMLAVLLLLGSPAMAVPTYTMSHTYEFDFRNYENYIGSATNVWGMAAGDSLVGIFQIPMITDITTGLTSWVWQQGNKEELTGIFKLDCTGRTGAADPLLGNIHWDFTVDYVEVWYEENATAASTWNPADGNGVGSNAWKRASTGISGNEQLYLKLDETGIHDDGSAATGYWYADWTLSTTTLEIWDGVYVIDADPITPGFQTGLAGIYSSPTQGSPYWLDIDQLVKSGVMVDFTSHGEILFTNTSGWAARSTDPLTAHPTPEPATMLLLGSGLIGLGWIGRRKLKK